MIQNQNIMPSDPVLQEAFYDWLKAQILELSVATLKSNAVTCTACGEVLGTYIVDYNGDRLRLSSEQAYAFLKFIQAH